MVLRTSHLLCAAIAASVLAAACGDGTATGPSGPVLQSLTVVGPSGSGGVILHRNETATATVTLSANAPGNAVVTLQTTGSERSALILPSNVTVARGSTSVTFPVTVTGSGVSAPAEVTLSASYNGTTQSVVIRLAP
jgi:asparagine N-glycosylation enzyme membrane subunit Stt3